MRPEAVLHRLVRAHLRKLDKTRLIYKLTTLGGYGITGAPDLMILEKPGRCWFIELKTEKGQLSRRQRRFQGWVTDLGFEYHVVRSIEDLELVLEARALIEKDIQHEKRMAKLMRYVQRERAKRAKEVGKDARLHD